MQIHPIYVVFLGGFVYNTILSCYVHGESLTRGRENVACGRGDFSATSMVVTPHCGDHSLSVDLTSDEISATGGRQRFARSHLVLV